MRQAITTLVGSDDATWVRTVRTHLSRWDVVLLREAHTLRRHSIWCARCMRMCFCSTPVCWPSTIPRSPQESMPARAPASCSFARDAAK